MEEDRALGARRPLRTVTRSPGVLSSNPIPGWGHLQVIPQGQHSEAWQEKSLNWRGDPRWWTEPRSGSGCSDSFSG